MGDVDHRPRSASPKAKMTAALLGISTDVRHVSTDSILAPFCSANRTFHFAVYIICFYRDNSCTTQYLQGAYDIVRAVGMGPYIGCSFVPGLASRYT